MTAVGHILVNLSSELLFDFWLLVAFAILLQRSVPALSQAQMATRNLTQKFETLRQAARQRRPASTRRGDPLLGDDNVSSDQVSIAVGLEHSLPPDWVDIVEGIQKDVQKTKDNCAFAATETLISSVSVKTLTQLHGDRLKVQFGDEQEAEKEREIDIVTKEITRVCCAFLLANPNRFSSHSC